MRLLQRFFARAFDPSETAQRAVTLFQRDLGPELSGVVAFGSWAVGEYVEGHSDLNLLVVARRLDAETIRRLAPAAMELAGPKCRLLYFSQTEFRRFAEASPLKFQDMAETRKVLHGEDPFLRLEFNAARLAEDLEHEARRLLIRFRHQWMVRPQAAEAANLASDTAGAVLPLLRGMLRLAKRKPPRQRVRVIEDACRQFHLSRRTLLQAHDIRYGRQNAGRIDAPGLLDRLLPELERLAELCSKAREEESQGHPAERRENRERPERPERGGGGGGGGGERDRGERDRERRDRGPKPALGGDRAKRTAEVHQMVTDASLKKRWEPKEPDRFAADDMGRDPNLGLAARFAWDRAWQSDRRAKGYVPVKPAEPEPPAPEDEVKAPAALSTEEAAAAAWADELDDEGTPGGAPSGETGDDAEGAL